MKHFEHFILRIPPLEATTERFCKIYVTCRTVHFLVMLQAESLERNEERTPLQIFFQKALNTNAEHRGYLAK